MPDLSEIEDYVRPYVGNCPAFIVQRQILMASRNFLQASRAWRDISTQVLSAGSREILLTFGGTEELVDISIDISGEYLTNAIDSNTLPVAATGAPVAFVVINGDTVMFSHAPLVDTTVRITAELKPGLSATTIPDAIYAQWLEAIEYGAIYNLLLMPRAEWSDAALGMEFQSRYSKELSKAKAQIRSGQSSGQTSARLNPLA